MIAKVKVLKKIGKFYDCAAKGDGLDCHRDTFVFAHNAYGKSTLVSVLRSLRDKDPKVVRARKTLGAVAAPEAVLVIDGANHVLNGTRWDRPFAAIQISDAPFIHASILAYEIGHEHKKNIHRVIIGATGKRLAEELAALKAQQKAKSQEVDRLESLFIQARFTFSRDAFLALPPTDKTAVASRIQALQQDIKSKESETVVCGLGFPRQVAAPSFDLGAAKALATKTLASAHETAETQVLSHIDRNIKDAAQARPLIRLGIDLLRADCPFCGQNLKNAAELLKAYCEFFDESFRAYQQSVAQQVAALANCNLDNDVTTLVSGHNANLATCRQWEPYFGAADLPDVAAAVDSFRPCLAPLKSKVQAELETKQKDPDAGGDLSPFDALETELGRVMAMIEAYNALVSAFVAKADAYLANLPKSDVASIHAELTREQQVELRFGPEWKKWATDYPAAKRDATAFSLAKAAKQKELEDYGKTIFDTYQKRINELLVKLSADFAVTGLTGKTDERANESYSDFGFLIIEQTVPITTRQDDAPCFKNTLSEGDKSTLAFAFLVVALAKTPELDKQIVVFDDPLSSLDETRRLGTVHLLADLSPRLNQLCVFTHKRDFLWMLSDGIRERVVLQIKSDKASGSRLESFDVDNDRKAEIASLCDDLGRYVEEDYGPTPKDMQARIRKVFEVILKTKYYRALRAEIKAKRGLGDLTIALHGRHLLDAPTKDQLCRLARLSDAAHHGGLATLPEDTLTRDEIRVAIQGTFSLAEKI